MNPDNGFLMVDADLNWNIFQNYSDITLIKPSAIDSDAIYDISCFF
ncbi:MAG: hypothetical protein ACJAZX_001559 [Rickettsiales bacterium]|jgi:hypothetical protein